MKKNLNSYSETLEGGPAQLTFVRGQYNSPRNTLLYAIPCSGAWKLVFQLGPYFVVCPGIE
jgi:hypothetical protein